MKSSAQELQGKETRRKGTRGTIKTITRSSCISSSSLLFPSVSWSSSYSSFMIVTSPPGPPSSPAGTYRTVTGMSALRPGILPPSTCFSSSSVLLTSAKNIAKTRNQNIGMTAILSQMFKLVLNIPSNLHWALILLEKLCHSSGISCPFHLCGVIG